MADTPLLDPARHEPLAGGPWDEAAARAAVERIARRCIAEADPAEGWPLHPQDDPDHPGQRAWPLYHGAAGTVWALRHLAEAGALPAGLRLDDAALLACAADRSAAELTGYRHGSASLLLGETGARLLQWRCEADPDRRAALLDRLHSLVAGNARNPCWEQLWGGPGTVLAAIALAEATGEPRWADLVTDGVQAIFDAMHPDADGGGFWLWTQQMYGRETRYLGAGHGLVGNLYPALRGAAFIPAPLREAMLERGLQALQALALHGQAPDGRPLVQWHALREPWVPGGKQPLVQDCHGAPGIVVRLAGAPRTPQWDALLLGAGEFTWQAGPLAKGSGLCHGTAGNGYAFLKLWRRTGDALWLDRARAFAMHAIGQVEAARARHGHGRPSLWTGDPGVACYLWQCVIGGDAFPTLDLL